MKSRIDVITDLTDAMNDFIQFFCSKQGLVFDGWVGDYPGGVAMFTNEMNLSFRDIVIDVMYDVPAGDIKEWYFTAEGVALSGKVFVNYNSWIKGFGR